MRGGLAEWEDRIACDPDALQERVQGELRMSDRGRDQLATGGISAAGNKIPRFRVEIGIEARQHHGAMGKPGDSRNQLGGRRHGTGRACGDDRAVIVSGEPRRLGFDQGVPTGGRLDGATLGEDGRPSLAGDLQELERKLPIAVERIRDEFVEPVPGHAAGGHVVHQASEIIGERERRRRIAGNERRFVFPVRGDAAGPLEHQLRQQHAAFEPADRRWQIERRTGKRTARCLCESDLVLVDVSDGDDAGKDRCAGSGHVEEDIAYEPAGPPRRQIERGTGQCERIMSGGKTRHQGSVDQRADQRRHERRRGRNGEDAGIRHAE